MISLAFGGLAPFVLEAGVANKIGAKIQSLRAQRPLILADRKLIATEEIVANIRKDSHSVAITEFDLDATPGAVESTIHLGRSAKSDVVIGLGDDNAMATAKFAACALAGSGEVADLLEERRFAERLPLILIPVGAGGGSEVSATAVLVTSSRQRSSFSSPNLRPDMAFLDPELAASVPWHVTAAIVIQALVHAIEAYTSRHRKNMVADMLARKAISLIVPNLSVVIERPEDLSVRGEMLVGSALAGAARANASGGAISALGAPLWEHFHVSQGVAWAPLLAPVLDVNAEKAHAQYAELAAIAGAKQNTASAFIDCIREALVTSNLFLRLRDLGVSRAHLDRLTGEAMKGSGSNYPLEVDISEARKLYELAF
ncbi:iron-containing alcohol dehydrogenase [Bradyrhizobium sp. CSA207]|uniref:iron-containing alcohol dehydrogenase n=1 Tax=Bradyrhizobium sp. CSA207 TaxID=2698826 RepID=UPI0023B15C08|nr:iron-containing alcohol dehydrogenase [Bradyrhizobium sp. CSA207]MDE5445766.1 iron-containing alcohol dehydrogenase [Bradyrhizobium sp. CSA207]